MAFYGQQVDFIATTTNGGNLANKMPQKISDEQWLSLGDEK